MAPNHVHSKSMPPTSFTLLIKLKSLFPIYSIKLWLHHYRIYVGHKFQLNRKFMQDLLTQLNFNYDNVLRSQLASYSLVNYRPLALFTLFRQEGEFKINVGMQECDLLQNVAKGPSTSKFRISQQDLPANILLSSPSLL